MILTAAITKLVGASELAGVSKMVRENDNRVCSFKGTMTQEITGIK